MLPDWLPYWQFAWRLSPPNTWGGTIFFFVSYTWGMENLCREALQGLLVLGAPNLLCRSGVRWWGSQAIFCLKTINDQSYKLKNSWCHNDLFHAFVFPFTFKLYVCHTGSSFHPNIEKCFYYCLIITLWKCEQYLIWTLKKSILFSSNSLEMSVLCGKFLL